MGLFILYHLKQADLNVVVVDWSIGAGLLNYPQSAANTRTMGAYTALVYDNLVRNGGSTTRMWCTGHSLGAHLCGHAGMKTRLDRVTGNVQYDSVKLNNNE